MFFSISMPIYNAESYLDESIESVINQTEKDFELLLVDDGSKDRSIDICRKWEKMYPEIIRVIQKENSGSLLTRRRCLMESKGDYLYIMDADDCLVEKNALKIIKENIIKYQVDLIFFAYKNENKEFHQNFKHHQIFEEETKKELYKLLLNTSSLNRLWDKVFSRQLVDWSVDYNKYTNVRVSTDIFQTIPIISNAKKVLYVDDVLYYYRTTSGSIIHSFNPYLFESQKEHNQRMREYAVDWGIDDIDLLLSNRLIGCACTAVNKTRMIKKNSEFNRKTVISLIGEDEKLLDAFKNGKISCIYPRKKKIIAYLLKYKLYGLLNCFMSMMSI